MGSYHQMGHHSDNLLDCQELDAFKGAVLSPVNDTQGDMLNKIKQKYPRSDDFEIVFDPQMYFPRTERQKLIDWPYFPSDFDTVDLSSYRWWQTVNGKLVAIVDELSPNAICSPVFVPARYSVDYFELMIRVTEDLTEQLKGRTIGVLQTIVVELSELTSLEQVMRIATVITQSKIISRVYLVLVDDTEPRREREDPEGLKGAMRLISLLEKNNIRVLVGYSSSDVILWKHAGATDCATGKFFNLRRFTPSRWDEPSGGGGQLPYWFEESLMAFLRESDLARIIRADLLSPASHSNPFSEQIKEYVRNGQPPWLGLSWRQYLYWFADIEQRLERNPQSALQTLREADHNWGFLDDSNIFMEERRNDGRWIRQWMRAIAEYQQ